MINPASIPEEFLHYIWESKLFKSDGIYTVNKELITIIDTGKRNFDSGPDFFSARVKIGSTLWAGNIEIHIRASDWYTHNHHLDKAYDNVILHVVEYYDKPVFNTKEEEIPTLVIGYPDKIKANYKRLLDSKTWIACAEQFHKIDLFTLKLGYHRLMVERLSDKTSGITQLLRDNRNDWNETFYQYMARMFGFKVNALPFTMLVKSVPLHILSNYRSGILRIEALLFGNAGMLNEQLLGDPYYLQLREEYSFLYKKHHLKGIESHLWKFMRLRPVNFPTIRIAQFAALVNKSDALFSKVLETKKLSDLQALFNVSASEYWDTHYRFNTVSKPVRKNIGLATVNILIINVVIPFLFVYGEIRSERSLKDRALEYLEKLPPEKNSIVGNWATLGVRVRSAFETQALLQLKNIHCDQKKCLNCQIGNKLVKT